MKSPFGRRTASSNAKGSPGRAGGAGRYRLSGARLRAAVSAVVLAGVAMVGIVSALSADGNHGYDVDLNDAGVWVTRADRDLIGRVNTEVDLIDTQVTTPGDNLQLLQSGHDVLVYEAETGEISTVDVRLSERGQPAELTPGALVALGADVATVLVPTTDGAFKVFVTKGSLVASLDVTQADPAGTVAGATAVVVGLDGTTYVLAASAGNGRSDTIHRFDPAGSPLGTTSLAEAVEGASLTVVGTTPVVLDATAGRVFIAGDDPVDLGGLGASPVLQQPGPGASTMLVATDTGLAEVALGSGSITELHPGTGAAVAPVRAGPCVFGAWEADASGVAICEGQPVEEATLEGITAGSDLELRVNRQRVVLNDLATGATLLLSDGEPRRIDDWSQALPDSSQTDDTTPSNGSGDGGGRGNTDGEDGAGDEKIDREGPNDPPQANDDVTATRAGRPRIIRPLLNDSDPDGDVLVIDTIGTITEAQGRVEVIDGGRALQFSPANGFVGSLALDYEISDGRGATAAASIAIEVVAADDANDAPTTLPDATVVEAGKVVVHDVLANDDDPEGDGLVLVGVGAGSNAAADGSESAIPFRPDGLVTFHAPSRTGTQEIVYTVRDELGEEAEGTLTVDVRPAGTPLPPRARSDHAVGLVGREIVVDLLANDSDPNNDALTVIGAEAADEALQPVLVDGRFLQVLATVAQSYDVVYTLSDGNDEDRAIVRVDVIDPLPPGPPIAVRDDAVARPGVAVLVEVLANDVDLDGDVLVIRDVSSTSQATVVEVIDHQVLSITLPPGQTESVLITYTVTDGVNDAIGTVVVQPYDLDRANQPPLPSDDVARVRAGSVVTIDVLRNDIDPDGDALAVAAVEQLAAGDGRVFTQGSVLRYRAPADERSVQFHYTIVDTAENRVDGLVTIDVLSPDPAIVNSAPRPPLVTARALAGEETVVRLPLDQMDPEGDPVSVLRIVQAPAAASVAIRADGRLLVTPNLTAGGTDSFTYEVQDSFGAKATGRVLLGVVPVPVQNSNPVALADEANVEAGESVRVRVLANDSDIDGDPLVLLAELGVPNTGTATVDGDVVVFDAPADVGPTGASVSFDYIVEDGRGGRDRGIVTVTILPPPETLTEDEIQALQLPPIARDDDVAAQAPGSSVIVPVLANDSDPDGDPALLTVTSVEPASAATVQPDRQVRVVVGATDTQVVYTITDAQGESASAVIRVPVIVNRSPVANRDDVTTDFETAVTVDVLANDSDPEGRPLSLTPNVSARNGTAVIAGSTVVFTPGAGIVGQVGFSYEISDGVNLASGTAVVTVRAKANQPPVWTALTLDVPAGGSRTVDLLSLVADPDPADRPQIVSVTGATGGVTSSLTGSTITVNATDNAKGQQLALSVVVDDTRENGRITGTVAVNVLASDKPLPVAVDDTAATNQETAVTIPVLANDVDPVGRGLTISATSVPAQGTVAIAGTSLTFTPALNFFGSTSFTYTVLDGTAETERAATGTVRVTVIGLPANVGAPTGVRGDSQVTLSWPPAAMNGGTFVRYEIEQATATGAFSPKGTSQSTSFQATGLTNGVDYRFRVRAWNSAGPSKLWSAASPLVQPDAVPGTPAAPQLAFGDGQIAVTWNAPANTGTAITQYVLELQPGNIPQTVSGSTTAYTWTGLTNGTAYTVRVRADNAAGPGNFSPRSAPQVPAGLPIVSVAPQVGVGNGQATVTWQAAAANGDPISAYRIFVNGAAQPDHTNLASLSLTVSGLSNGTTYQFTVAAQNKAGWSPPGPATAGAPSGPPLVPSGQSAAPGVRQATVTFTVPSNNGAPITSFDVQVSGGASGTTAFPASNPAAGSNVTLTYTGLPNGGNVAFAIRACNANGCGPFSGNTNSVTIYNVPGAPTITNATQGAAQNAIRIDWSTPPNGGTAITGYEVLVDGGTVVGVGNVNTWAHNGLGPGETHSYAVRALNAAGPGPWSGTVNGTTAPPPQPPTITLTNGGSAAPNPGRWYSVFLSNFTPGSVIALTCRDSRDPAGFWNQNFTINGSGQAGDTTLCFSADGPDHWVTSNVGVDSNHVAW